MLKLVTSVFTTVKDSLANYLSSRYRLRSLSESQAEFSVIISLICFLIIILLRWKKRRLALGKSVELDTDNDGYISEE